MYNKRLHKVSHQTEFKSDLFDKVYYADIDDIVGYIRRAYLGITTTSGDKLRFYNVTVMSPTESYDQELRTALNNDLSSISTISIPDTVTAINEEGLNFAWYVKNVTIPASVEVFGGGNGAYIGSTDISDGPEVESIEFLGPNTKLNDWCLEYCYSLTSVTLPTNLTEIPEGCFNRCINLTSIELPSTLLSIGSQAFLGTKLNTIVIPETVTMIGGDVFYDCSNLTAIYYKGSAINENDNLWGAENATLITDF